MPLPCNYLCITRTIFQDCSALFLNAILSIFLKLYLLHASTVIMYNTNCFQKCFRIIFADNVFSIFLKLCLLYDSTV